MKKIITIALAVLMLAAMAVVVSAEDTANWAVGNGYNIVDADKNEMSKNSPVTAKENADTSVTVTHGGYYQNGENWGGVVSKNLYTIDGLSIKVKFDKFPKVEAGTDCWAYIGILDKAQMFQVGKVSENPGFMNLIRFANGVWEIYDGVTDFKGIENSDADDMFKIQQGDTVTITFTKQSNGLYNVKYENKGKNYTPVTEFDFDKIFTEGKAHAAVSASLIGSEKDAFGYTVTVNGEKSSDSSDLSNYEKNDPEPGVVKVYVNGKRVEFDQQPVIQDGRTLVPVRAIFEALGATVTWDDATKTVTAKKGDVTVNLKIGSTQLFKNGAVAAALDVPAQIINERTLVPARAVSEAFGANVGWVDATKSVVITD